MELQVQQVQLVQPDLQELLELQVQQDQQVLLGQQESLELQVQQVQLVQPDLQELLEHQVQQDQHVQPDQQELQEHQVQQVQQDLLGLRVLLVHQDLQDQLVELVLQESRVQVVQQDLQVLPGQQELLEHLDLQVQQELQEQVDQPGRLDYQEELVPLVLLAPMANRYFGKIITVVVPMVGVVSFIHILMRTVNYLPSAAPLLLRLKFISIQMRIKVHGLMSLAASLVSVQLVLLAN